ncbi:hypothetical protein TWF281_006893 [Arthrobotrys megalospora]
MSSTHPPNIIVAPGAATGPVSHERVMKLKTFCYKEGDDIPSLPRISRELEDRAFAIRWDPGDQVTPYRQLEQKGDAVFNAAVVMLLTDHVPELGWLEYQFLRANLVSNSQLSSFAKMYKLDERHPPSEREKLPADLQEAYIGALATEQGMAAAMEFSTRLVKPAILHYRKEFRRISGISGPVPGEAEPRPLKRKFEEVDGDREGDEREVSMTNLESQIFKMENFGYFMTNRETKRLLRGLMDLLSPSNPEITLKFGRNTWATRIESQEFGVVIGENTDEETSIQTTIGRVIYRVRLQTAIGSDPEAGDLPITSSQKRLERHRRAKLRLPSPPTE